MQFDIFLMILSLRSGHYCVDGVKYPCPSGRYGSQLGLIDKKCSGLCSRGYYCPIASINDKQMECGDPGLYCPTGSSAPLRVQNGHYSHGGNKNTTHFEQILAPPGSYALNGILFSCPGGVYGSDFGLSSSNCNGHCIGGFYCPEGSTNAKQIACGSPDRFCPKGSAKPKLVKDGHYSSKVEEPCPPGMWRNTTKINDATIFPKVLKSAIPTKSNLSTCEFCPEGRYKFNAGNDFTSCLLCPKYTSKSNAVRSSCVCISDNDVFDHRSGTCIKNNDAIKYLGINFYLPSGIQVTKDREQLCERGFYCINGTRYPCPAGSFGNKTGDSNPACEGKCDPGYFCLEGSSSSTQYACDAVEIFCPEGSAAPSFVGVGRFSDELRTTEIECPPGFW